LQRNNRYLPTWEGLGLRKALPGAESELILFYRCRTVNGTKVGENSCGEYQWLNTVVDILPGQPASRKNALPHADSRFSGAVLLTPGSSDGGLTKIRSTLAAYPLDGRQFCANGKPRLGIDWGKGHRNRPEL
jgi:hypothetical protein